MATPPSDSPPSSEPGKPPNPVSVEPSNGGNLDTKVEAVRESSPTSVFVNSEPIREEQVQNAMKFLSHPKVRGSPVMYRRSFLERKGLTKEEIDEAFRRVPDTMPDASTTQPAVSSQDGQIKTSLNVQQQPPTQLLQSAVVAPVGSAAKIGMLSQFHWYHAILAVGFLAVSGAGTAVFLKKSVVPRLKSWIRKVASEEDEEGLIKKNDAKPTVAEEAAAAAKAAAVAAADVARASQEMLTTKREEKRCFEELLSMLNAQVREMKSMSNSIQKLESGQGVNGRIALDEQDNQRFLGTSSRQPYTNGKTDTESRSVRSTSPPVSAEPPHPKSYMEIMSMIQRGEKPSNIREINDAPPNPNQPLTNPRAAPRPKPWEVSQPQNTSVNNYSSQESSNGTTYTFQDNQPNGDDGVPWWQKKNVRITEVESSEEHNFGSSNMPAANDRPLQRSWVPPQPPPVVIPEAAMAIRQPKKAASQAEPMNDDQFLARSGDATDELQKITRYSETAGGSMEASSGFSDPSSTEIQREEDNGSYLET
ncbi:peroxisomal membrane protein PEX14-like [Salvia splendens]|uniref:peroxisomal membrane protein PEX14-like n=1 Tax=Salvia splendens TaxID=180675 RepID=UPI001C264B02|nr:peroxisomal membrane protein PEX14-like [Salvia splendens]